MSSAHSRQASADLAALSDGLGGGGSGAPGGSTTPASLSGTPSAAGLAAAVPVGAGAAVEQQQRRRRQAPEPAWLAAEGAPPQRRTRLPPPAQKERSVSLWSLIKEMVGKVRDRGGTCMCGPALLAPAQLRAPLAAKGSKSLHSSLPPFPPRTSRVSAYPSTSMNR